MSNEENVKEQDAVETQDADTKADQSEPAAADTVAEEPVAEQAPAAEDTTVEKTEERSEQTKPAKQKPEKAKSNTDKIKLFKYIYYPVLALFVALMFIFSVIDGVYGYSPDAYGEGYYTAVNKHITELSKAPRSAMSSSVGGTGIVAARSYIVDTLVAGGFAQEQEDKPETTENDEEQKTVTGWHKGPNGAVPTVTLFTSKLDGDLQQGMANGEYLVGTEITDIVAGIPSGKANAKSVVITVRYDSRPDSVGAADNAAFVANAIQTLIQYASSGTKFTNDIIVVFTEDLDRAYGAYAFFDAFEGFDNAASRAVVGVSLEAYGNSGTLALTDASGAGYDYLNAYTKISGSVFNSSVVPASITEALKRNGSVAAFGDIPALQVAVLGGLDAAQSPLDTAENISQSIVRQQAQFLKDYIDEFGKTTGKFSAQGEEKTAFFSYLDGGTVAYTEVASYVVGALIIALLAAVIAVTAVKKTFSLKNMFVAAGVQLLVILGTLVSMVAAYFLVTLMLTGFGVLPLHAITQLRYFNAGIFIAAVIISVAAAFGFTSLLKKMFRVTSSEVVRGTAVLFGAAGAVMSFACPQYSFITSWLGLLLLAVLLVSVCCHRLFKNKFGFGMDRLYLYAIPVALCLPLVMPQISMLMWLLPLTMMPVTMMLFSGMLGVAVPYLDRTRAVFDRLAKKLPKRTIRVQRTVTERVEDRAKRGKFTEVTVKRVEKEKIPVNYKNYFGISVLAVLGIVIALFSGGFGVTFGKSLTSYHTYDDALYNDAIVYEREWTGSSSNATQRIVVNDLIAYKFLRYSISDLEWDGTRYVKTVNYSRDQIMTNEPSINKVDGVYNVTPYDGAYSSVKITIPNASSITKITIKERSKEGNADYEGYVYEFDRESSITLRLPYGFGNFTMTFEGYNPTRFEYEEHRQVSVGGVDHALDNVDEWNRTVREFAGTDVAKYLRGAIVLKCTLSV